MPIALALDAAVAFARRYSGWLKWGVIALALACAWLRGNHYQHDRDAWKSAFTTQKSAYVAAEAAASAKAIAAKIRTENQSAELARKADHAETIVDDLRAAADRLATRRVRPAATCGAPSGAASPAPAGPSPDRDGLGADAVVLTRPEYDELVSNSLRLERVRRWGESLIAAKLAVPEMEFGD